MQTRHASFLIALFLSACATVEQSAELTAPESSAPLQVSGVRFAGKDISAYKGQIAQHIVGGHKDTFSGDLPPILKSIVVLDLTVDRDGRISRVIVSRSNGFKELERVALDSVRRIKVFPPPPANVLNGKTSVRYLETWLFRDDGKFQIRSLVKVPQPGAEKLASAS